jgi:uncharacterized membrane protein YeaQ/YmgE (transglycosylase-associated protein family)
MVGLRGSPTGCGAMVGSVGAVTAGVIADLVGVDAASWTVAALTALSGLTVVVRIYETHRPTTPANMLTDNTFVATPSNR